MCGFTFILQDSLYFVRTVCGLSITSAKSIISSPCRHHSASSRCVFSVSVHLRRGSLVCTLSPPKKTLNQLWSQPAAPGSKWALIHKKALERHRGMLGTQQTIHLGIRREELNFTQPFTPPTPCEQIYGGLECVRTHGHVNTVQRACIQRFNPFYLSLQRDFAPMARKPSLNAG